MTTAFRAAVQDIRLVGEMDIDARVPAGAVTVLSVVHAEVPRARHASTHLSEFFSPPFGRLATDPADVTLTRDPSGSGSPDALTRIAVKAVTVGAV